MSTTMPKAGEITRKWYILDAADKPLGRTATGWPLPFCAASTK